MFKYFLFGLLGLGLGWLINDYYDNHSAPEPAKVSEVVPSNISLLSEDLYAKNGITMWRDDKHGVVCFIYEAGIAQTARAGISCLPRGQVLP